MPFFFFCQCLMQEVTDQPQHLLHLSSNDPGNSCVSMLEKHRGDYQRKTLKWVFTAGENTQKYPQQREMGQREIVERSPSPSSRHVRNSVGLWWSFLAVREPSAAVPQDWWACCLSHLNQTCLPPKLSSGLFTSYYRERGHPSHSHHGPKHKGMMMLMLSYTVNIYSFTLHHNNQKDIDWSSLRPCNCTPCCQSFDVICLCSNQSSESRAHCCSVTLISCCCRFTSEAERCAAVPTERRSHCHLRLMRSHR